MSRSIFFAALSLLTGCTFNTSWFSRDISSMSPASPSVLVADFSHLNSLSGSGVRVEGSAMTDTSAVVTIAGLLGTGVDPATVASGVHIDWPVDSMTPTTRHLTVGYDGALLETVWTEGVLLTLPAATSLTLTLGATSAEVDGVTAPIDLAADSGSIDVRGAGEFTLVADSGSIDVAGHTGTATCTSGSVHLTLDGAITGHANSGSIDGQFGGGGELTTESGSIDVVLVGALDRDLTLSATSGSIHLTVPVGTSMQIETHTGSGSSHVQVGGVSSNDDFTGTIGSGGFLVHATTSSGSISIDER